MTTYTVLLSRHQLWNMRAREGARRARKFSLSRVFRPGGWSCKPCRETRFDPENLESRQIFKKENCFEWEKWQIFHQNLKWQNTVKFRDFRSISAKSHIITRLQMRDRNNCGKYGFFVELYKMYNLYFSFWKKNPYLAKLFRSPELQIVWALFLELKFSSDSISRLLES